MCLSSPSFRSLLVGQLNKQNQTPQTTFTQEENDYVPPMFGVKSGSKYKRNMAKRKEYWRDKRAAEKERAAADLKIEPDINDPNPTPSGGINY
jgi:hypothetical protein